MFWAGFWFFLGAAFAWFLLRLAVTLFPAVWRRAKTSLRVVGFVLTVLLIRLFLIAAVMCSSFALVLLFALAVDKVHPTSAYGEYGSAFAIIGFTACLGVLIYIGYRRLRDNRTIAGWSFDESTIAARLWGFSDKSLNDIHTD
jgi:hypothetical protein